MCPHVLVQYNPCLMVCVSSCIDTVQSFSQWGVWVAGAMVRQEFYKNQHSLANLWFSQAVRVLNKLSAAAFADLFCLLLLLF